MKSVDKWHRQNRNKFIVVLFLLIAMITFTVWFTYYTFKPQEEKITFWDEDSVSMNSYVKSHQYIWDNDQSMGASYLKDNASWITSLNLVKDNYIQLDNFIKHEDTFIEHGLENGVMTWDEYLNSDQVMDSISDDEYVVDKTVLFVDTDLPADSLYDYYFFKNDITISNCIVIFKDKVAYDVEGSEYSLKITNSFVYNMNTIAETAKLRDDFIISNSYIYGNVFEQTNGLTPWDSSTDIGIYNSLIRSEYREHDKEAIAGDIVSMNSQDSYFDNGLLELNVEI